MSPSTNVWKELTDLPFKIAEASSVSMGIGLMMFGGVIQESDVDALHKANCFENSSSVDYAKQASLESAELACVQHFFKRSHANALPPPHSARQGSTF